VSESKKTKFLHVVTTEILIVSQKDYIDAVKRSALGHLIELDEFGKGLYTGPEVR
jgi:hypothetical protein